MTATLAQLYYSPKTGFRGLSELQRLSGRSTAEIKAFLDKQEVHQLHRRQGKRNYYPITGPAGTYQMDLTFFDQYSGQNSGYKIILTAIEVSTRRGYAKPLKSKSAKPILEATKEIIKEAAKYTPFTVVGTDQGSEFKDFFYDLPRTARDQALLG
eukprot:Lithocolla_globosa_v1_NODE_115_length_6172_cov_14.462155.p6 type:complete len:155 gc:universal NODE_115_length_6172_cov_14.462155:2955-2491(-)